MRRVSNEQKECLGGLFGVASRVGRFLSPSLVLLPSICLFGLSCFRGCLGLLVFCSRASFPTVLQLGKLMMRLRYTIDDQGEKAHAGVFKSSPSRMSDELTGTCSSQECSWQLDARYSDIV